MNVWTIAFGVLIGKIMFGCWRELWNIIDRILTKYMDKKNPNWRYKKYNKADKPREPIGFKQNMIES